MSRVYTPRRHTSVQNTHSVNIRTVRWWAKPAGAKAVCVRVLFCAMLQAAQADAIALARGKADTNTERLRHTNHRLKRR